MSRDPRCDRCTVGRESSLHAVRDYLYSKGVWEKIMGYGATNEFFQKPLNEWMTSNFKIHRQHQHKEN